MRYWERWIHSWWDVTEWQCPGSRHGLTSTLSQQPPEWWLESRYLHLFCLSLNVAELYRERSYWDLCPDDEGVGGPLMMEVKLCLAVPGCSGCLVIWNMNTWLISTQISTLLHCWPIMPAVQCILEHYILILAYIYNWQLELLPKSIFLGYERR